MSGVVIEANSLTKTFRDGVVAVKDLDLEVRRGAVYGLVGRNGSGKTTTLRMVVGLLHPDRGAARVLGWDFWRAPRGVRQRVAYVGQTQQLPGSMTLEELSRCLTRWNDRWDLKHARALADGGMPVKWRTAQGGYPAGLCRPAAGFGAGRTGVRF